MSAYLTKILLCIPVCAQCGYRKGCVSQVQLACVLSDAPLPPTSPQPPPLMVWQFDAPGSRVWLWWLTIRLTAEGSPSSVVCLKHTIWLWQPSHLNSMSVKEVPGTCATCVVFGSLFFLGRRCWKKVGHISHVQLNTNTSFNFSVIWEHVTFFSIWHLWNKYLRSILNCAWRQRFDFKPFLFCFFIVNSAAHRGQIKDWNGIISTPSVINSKSCKVKKTDRDKKNIYKKTRGEKNMKQNVQFAQWSTGEMEAAWQRPQTCARSLQFTS